MKTLVLAAAMSLALCGLGHAGETSIKIGVLGDQSGAYADIGGKGAVTAARMAVEDYGGKAMGKPIEIVSADMLNKPDVASNIARQWFDNEHVDAIVDLPVTAVALAVEEIGRERKKVVMVTNAAAADITGKQCSPTAVHWMDNTDALGVGTTRAVIAAGGKRWYMLTPDYSFGYAMESAATRTIQAAGGQVVGTSKFPFGTPDYSSYLVQAAAADAQVYGLSTVGGDTINAVKQANEFGLTRNGRKIVMFVLFLPEVHSLGLSAAHGLYVTTGFYWDQNEASRAWAKRFFARENRMPSRAQANTYAAVTHYLKALDAAGTDAGPAVVARMRAMPGDYFGKTATVQKNGRVIYDLDLYEAKSPEESHYPWDYYKAVSKLTPSEVYGTEAPEECRR